jgi:hypothetical protein
MAIKSPGFKRYNRQCLLANHLNDIRHPNNSSTLTTIFSSRQEEPSCFSYSLLDHLSGLSVVSLDELATLVVRSIGYCLYQPETEELNAEAASVPPLDLFLDPLVSRGLRRLALCVYSMCIQYGKLQYVINAQSHTCQLHSIKNSRVTKWHFDFASGQDIWALTQNISEIVRASVMQREKEVAQSDIQKLQSSTYVEEIFFKPPDMGGAKRKYLDMEMGENALRQQLQRHKGCHNTTINASTNTTSTSTSCTSGESRDSSSSSMAARAILTEQRAQAEYLQLVCLPEEEVGDPVRCAARFSVKLGEFVHSASLVSE